MLRKINPRSFYQRSYHSADNVITLAHSILEAMAKTHDSFVVDFDAPPELKKARPDLYKPLEPAEIAKVKERIGFALST